jgi:hypothetical protein
MAQKVHIVLEDDIDGGEATQTVTFALDGTNYEIDLNDNNAERLRDALSAFVGHARKVSGGGRRGGRRGGSAGGASTGGASAKEIRQWAIEAGHEVPERGRIPANVREAYEAAH